MAVVMLLIVLLAFIAVLVAGVVYLADPTVFDVAMERLREPSFPCCECEHYMDGERNDGKCTACYDGVSGEPKACCWVRASKRCAKSARKVG